MSRRFPLQTSSMALLVLIVLAMTPTDPGFNSLTSAPSSAQDTSR